MPRLRDPIHGFIELTELELEIVDSAPFQRLRNIKQLATTYLVYHGAEHTRFGHSLGVMHLVDRAFCSATENYSIENGEQLFSDIDAAWYRQLLRLIALVHDLGHAPFSHGSEALFNEGLEHEDFTKKIICETEISGIIGRIGEEFCRKYEVDDSYQITPQLLWSIYGEKNPESNPQYMAHITDFKFLKTFMDSELDCDKMDYLLRDSYYCGVNYGKYDLNRVIDSLESIQKSFQARAFNIVPKGQPTENILKGKVICGCCGRKMQRKRGSDHADWYFFTCITKNRLGIGRCTGMYAREEDVFNTLYHQLKVYVREHYITDLQNEQQIQKFNTQIIELTQSSEKAWANAMKYYEQYIRGETSKEALRAALDAAHAEKMMLVEVTEQKAVYDEEYSIFRKLLFAGDKHIPLSKIMDCIEKIIIIDTGRKIVVEWS